MSQPAVPFRVSVSKQYADVLKNKPTDYWDYERDTLSFGKPDDYQLLRKVGRGKYSEAFRAVNVKADPEAHCVIKVLKAVKRKKVKREVKILENLSGGPNIIGLLDLVYYKPTDTSALVMEAVNNVDARQLYRTFKTHDIQFYMYQLLLAMDYAHSHGIMHRDIKPQNVMIDPQKQILRLIDWGLADFYHPRQEYNCRVASRYFKAPELLIEYCYYDYSLDMWSFGCMMAALIFRKDPFFQGVDNKDQLVKIIKVLGMEDLRNYAKKYRIRLDSQLLKPLYRQGKRHFFEFLTDANADLATDDALDLVTRLLVYDHAERLTASKAMSHPYFSHIVPPLPPGFA